MKMPKSGVAAGPMNGGVKAREQCLAFARFKFSKQAVEFEPVGVLRRCLLCHENNLPAGVRKEKPIMVDWAWSSVALDAALSRRG